MKNYQRTLAVLRNLSALLFSASLALPLASQAASLTLATAPLATSTTSTVLPNVMLMLDNSGSMAWLHMPDDASDGGSSVPFSYGYYGERTNQCNMVYYDPNTTYLAPVNDTGTAYTDASFINARTNGYSTSTCSSSTCINLNTGYKAADINNDTLAQSAYYYSYSGAQLTQTQKEYNSNSNAFYKECHDSTGSSVSAIAPVNGVKALTGGTPSTVGSGVFTKHRYATTETTTITISGSGGGSSPYASVSGITVNGVQIMNAASATASGISSSTMATNIATQINAKTATSGFSATTSSSVVTVTGPASAADFTPAISTTGGMGSITLTPDVFPITSSAGLTNFANWYSFYRTRLLMMKTAAGRAFKALDAHYRVGFAKISASSTPTLYLDTFSGSQRTNWYSALYGTVTSGSTPLREALANMGRYYAGKLSGTDSMQYSCQQNFTILSTDGFWNGNSGFQMNGSTAVGNQDGSADRPMYDGSNRTKTTSTVGESKSQTSQQSSNLFGTLSKVLMRCNNTTAACGSAPSTGVANSNWSVVTSGSCTTASNVQCAAVSGLSGSYAVVNQCKTTASITTSTVASFTITVTGVSSSTRIDSIKIAGNEILTGKTSSSSNSSNNQLATNIEAKIGNGYSSSVSGNVITVTQSGITGSSTLTSYHVSNGGPATLTGAATVTSTTYTLSNADSNGRIYSACAYSAWTTATFTASCTTANQSATPNNTTVVAATQCNLIPLQSPTLVASCTASNSGAPNYIQTTCTPSTTVQNNLTSCTPAAPTASNGYQTVTCSTGTGGTSDNLADVAMYYYQTDLRTTALGNCTGAAGVDVCLNNVFKTDMDNQTQQHMSTFTLGLGASGYMQYSPSYLTDSVGDYYSVWKGLTASSTATPPICSWKADGSTCNWPDPGSGGDLSTIDDLWHAAVDGHGQYFSATSPTSLSAGLSNALASIASRKGASAAAATSTLNPVAGNNYAYVASYTTVKWQGNLEARTIDVNTGVISPSASWCVQSIAQGDCAAPATINADTSGSSTVYSCVTAGSTAGTCISPDVFDSATSTCSVPMATGCAGTMLSMIGANSDTRTIYTANVAGTALISFGSGTDATANAAYAAANLTNFNAAHISGLSQWPLLTTTQQTAAQGANLVSFLRGQTGFEDRAVNLVGSVDNRLYRYREATLGDALESQPVYSGKPVFSYIDKGYSGFVSAQSSRLGTVFMGTNDGMLHAFSALAEGSVAGGTERWAYVPSMVIPNMWKLADKGYANLHTNFINGSPIISDVCTAHCLDSDPTAAVWRTILVGGLNGGGRGYYALDVTSPNSPTLLWEFTPATDSDVGYSYGNPVITAKADGTWVVLVTSGYNNTSPGTGLEYLYVLNAATGAVISKIGTGAGSTTTPGGLSKISAWSDTSASNRATYVYGGDLLGNLWRFDINAVSTPFLLANLQDPSGTPQPVTTSPVLGKIQGMRVVFVGTGQYLQTADLSNTQVQSEYAIKDNNATVTLTNPAGSPRNSLTLVQQSMTDLGNGTRSGSSNTVDWTNGRGWYIDFPITGERSNIESKLVQGTLLVATIVPSNTVCSPGGSGWLNFFDYLTGGSVDSSGIVSASYTNSIVGINVLYINGAPVIETVTSNDPTPTVNTDVLIKGTPSGFIGKRVLWRQLNP